MAALRVRRSEHPPLAPIEVEPENANHS